MTRPEEGARRRGARRAAGPVRSAAGPSAGFLVFLGACSAWAAAATLLPPKPYGAALSPHAIHHIAVARSLLAGEGFTSLDGGPHTLYPLLLPLVLAAAGRLGPDPLHLAGPLNAAFFALSVFFVGRFLTGRLESRFLRLCYASDRWMNSPTVRFLRTDALDALDAAAGPIYSNLPWLVYLLETRGRGPILRLPPHRPGLHRPPPFPEGSGLPATATAAGPPPSRPRDSLRRWLRSAPEGAPIVWFRAPLPSRSLDFGLPALRMTPGVEPVAEFEDGAVFVVNRGYAAATNRYDAALERIRSGAAGPPAARSAFDLYLEERAMLYLREPCSPEDEAVRGLFFVETAPPEAAPRAVRRPPDASSAGAGFVFPFVE